MPTSSQALVLLKHFTDGNGGGSASAAASISVCHLPTVFPQRFEDKADADLTSSVGLRVHGEVLQQKSQGRSCGSELVLPPIDHPATHPLTLVTRNPRKTPDTICNKQSTTKKWIEGIDEHEVTLTEHGSIVSISGINNASQLQHSKEAETTRSLQDKTHSNTQATRQEQRGSPFLWHSYPRTTPTPAWCSQQSKPDHTPGIWTPGEPSPSHDAIDTSCQKPVLTCVLNLNLWDQSCETHYDNSSCIGILSYNHQMGRHEWNLVPQNSPVPLRAVRGRYMKTKNSADCPIMSDVPDQSGNFNDGPQHRKGSHTDIWTEPAASELSSILSYNHQMGRQKWNLVPQNSPVPLRAVRGRYMKTKNSADCPIMSDVPDQSGNFNDGPQYRKGSHTDIWTEPAASELSNNAGDEEMKDENQPLRQEVTDSSQAHQSNNVHPGPVSTHFHFGGSPRKQNRQQDPHQDSHQLQQQTRSERLVPSGIIYNESYYFGKDDAEDTVPHFLETLIRPPKSDEEPSYPYLANMPGQGHWHRGYSAPLLKCHGFKVAQKPALNQRIKGKLHATAHKTTQHKVSFKSQQPSEPQAAGKHQSPERHSKGEERVDKMENVQEAVVSDRDPAAQTEASTQMSSPAEPRVLRMRTELPPSHPNRLCFRTTMSGCSHTEVVHEMESQKNVKVTWLQYEPISLHYTDIAKPDYCHLCMWMFELSSDSDTSRLLLEGFKLRGQHMNVLHLDDVYLEEFRTFSLCNEIFMEQRSKHLISSKAKRLVKASVYYQ